MKTDFRRRAHRWQVSFINLLPVLAVLGVFGYFLLSSGNDHYRACTSPNYISRFRGVGIGANRTFSRIIEKPHDDIPVVVTPDAANISETFFAATTTLSGSRPTNLLWAWLQFVSNDMILTRPGDANDTLFAGTGVPLMTRSSHVLDYNGDRQQVNFETPYLDGSHIYGVDLLSQYAIRRSDGTGKLVSVFTPDLSIDDSEVPPFNATTGLFSGVDNRINQNPLVAALYVLFVREHNTWCDKIKVKIPGSTENEIFNIARHLVAAEIQAITYREVVPVILGVKEIDSGICFSHTEDMNGHSDHKAWGKFTSVTNEFAAAAVRIGHSMVTDTLDVRDVETGDIISPPVPTLTQPGPYIWDHGIGPLLLGARMQQSNARDISIASVLRAMVGPQDITRGRDHQLPSYQNFYSHFTDHVSVTCSEYASNPSICTSIATIYGSADAPIDLFLGLLAEKRIGSSLLGIVGNRLFKYQFAHLKHSDHYFYLWDRVVQPFFAEIHNMRLHKIILRNTDVSQFVLKPNVFTI